MHILAIQSVAIGSFQIDNDGKFRRISHCIGGGVSIGVRAGIQAAIRDAVIQPKSRIIQRAIVYAGRRMFFF